MKKYIFVGGGFDPSTLTFVLPIIEGYIGKDKITLLFSKKEFQTFKYYLKNSNLKLNKNKILNDIKFFYPNKIKFKYLIFVLIKIIKNINYFFQLIFNYSFKEIDFKSNFSHAFWDSCIVSLNDKQLKPPLKKKYILY